MDPDAVLLHITLMGNQETMSADGVKDKDLSIRPGDMVQLAPDSSFVADTVRLAIATEGGTVRREDFVQNIACMEKFDELNSTDPSICDGAPPATGKHPSWLGYLSDFEADEEDGYYQRNFMDKGKIGVAVLVDQSGSMKGLVDKHTSKEVDFKEGQVLWNQPDWEPDGSDPKSQHITAIDHFLLELNRYERSIVFQYGGATGQKPELVCWIPEPKELPNLEDKYRYCYSDNRGLILDAHPELAHKSSELAKLVNGGEGRTPLWEAVLEAYDFMTWADDTESRHVVVVGDGPDTCHPDSPDFMPLVQHDVGGGNIEYVKQEACSSVGYEEVRDRILADRMILDNQDNRVVPDVHIHFVQFQAPGYLERDPRQQELACLTGGHYLFVNSDSIPNEDEDAPPEEANPITGKYLYPALDSALMKVRYALAGTWALAIDLPGLPQRPRGSQMALKGDIKLPVDSTGCSNPPCGITSKDMIVNLGFGLIGTQYESQLAQVDIRPVFRHACSIVDDCAWFEDSNDVCSDRTCLGTDLVCDEEPVTDGTDCTKFKACGSDGCGGECGSCPAGSVCNAGQTECVCEPQCQGKVCGDDGCGGSCGNCKANEQCSADQTSCECTPECTDRVCGDDGCGGTCAPGCEVAEKCSDEQTECVDCTPDCTGKVCGDNGCDGTCDPGCGTGEQCAVDQASCVCAPDCEDKVCGDDGCGGSCGTCKTVEECAVDQKSCQCVPICTDKECGDDGCGGLCGECMDPTPHCGADGKCADTCLADCTGKKCGDDGCGGSCGECGTGEKCNEGQCCTPECGLTEGICCFGSCFLGLDMCSQ